MKKWKQRLQAIRKDRVKADLTLLNLKYYCIFIINKSSIV